MVVSTHGQCLGMQTKVIYPAQSWGLGLNETLLPQHLRELGYSTHAVGKVGIPTNTFNILFIFTSYSIFYGILR